MRFLRFTLLAVAAAAASAFAAVPASAQVPTNNPAPPALEETVTCPANGSIKLYKTADRAEYDVNAIVTFTLRVRVDSCNTGGVVVHDQLPAGLKVADPAVLTHDYGAIPAGGERSYTFQATAVTPGTWTNRAKADAVFVGFEGEGCAPRIQAQSQATPGGNVERPDPPRVQTCRKSANAEVSVKVIDPPGRTNPTPTPTQPSGPKATPKPTQPSSPKAPSLPNTGRQE